MQRKDGNLGRSRRLELSVWFSPKGEITADQLGREFADLFVNALKRNVKI
jgi:hypothetical protein